MNQHSTRSLRMRMEMEDPLYPGMRKIKLRGKDLSYIPNNLFALMELEVLDMSPERQSCLDYRIPDLPPSIGRLVNLKVLILDTNELLQLPPEIGLIHQLERIALSNNHLTSLPPSFSNLKHLRSLHLANNDFSDFPPQICSLNSLRFLDLSDNNLTSLPGEISELTELETFFLFYNSLTSLPDSICSLTQMQCLWLGGNRIRVLPRHFGRLKKLDWNYRYISSALEGNPLIHPPIELCRMGPDAIERYFSTMDAGRSRAREKSPDSIRSDRSLGKHTIIPQIRMTHASGEY